jgi:hypothetical protein
MGTKNRIPETKPNFPNRSVSVPSSVPVSEYPKYPSTELKFPNRTEVPEFAQSYIYIHTHTHPSYILYSKLHNLTCFTLQDFSREGDVMEMPVDCGMCLCGAVVDAH